MKRVAWTVLGLLVVVALLCFPAVGYGGTEGGDEADEDTTITSYLADFTLDADGTLHVVETLTVDFPNPGKHGIFRYWDRTDPRDPHVRRTPYVTRVTRDGAAEPFDVNELDGRKFVVAQIGDADTTLSTGAHTYVIDYSVSNAVDTNDPSVTSTSPDAAASMFYWQLVPRGWQQRIGQATLTVHLPVPAQADVACAVGDEASSGCQVQGGGTTELTVTTGPIEPRTPVTVATALAMPVPEPSFTVPWSPRWDSVLGTDVPLLLVVLALAALATGLGALLGARSRERPPGFGLQYAPPPGIGPAQAVYVMDEDVDRTTWVATMMYAAERGAITLTRDGDDWTITDKAGPEGWSGLDSETRGLASLLSGPGTSFTAQRKSVTAGERLGEEVKRFEKSVEEWGTSSGNLARTGAGCGGGLLVLGGFALMVVCLVFSPGGLSIAGLIPGGFAVAGLSLISTGASTRRTPQGRQLWSQVGGFKRVLSTESSEDRFDFSGRQELYTAYVPWAVAFGCADTWARKYRVETGAEPPAPSYLPAAYGASAGSYVDSVVDSFDSAVGSAISSYNATQSSSSSSGGGFSGGGGGGGGGGGSW
ncbi:DUF2207 family protein [Nocardioides flavescens]|uniref:DUF2207 domain-containing protein n=1 Tax=Nocardioides flavescens TaxID=2691959 RepID=A0A6L7EUK5_9ACTN|nr:DUF2207 domain-containing protein [Nocardioides flavescens]